MKTFNISINLAELTYSELSDADRELVDAAKKATYNSYTPYSRFSVGAALRLDNGQTFIGCNQENAAYPVAICAERTAIFASQAQCPGTTIETIAVSARNVEGEFVRQPISPCGSCRQVMLEQEYRAKHPMRVILVGEDRIFIAETAKDILPLSFVETDMQG